MVFDGLEFDNPDWDFSEGGNLGFKVDEKELAIVFGCDSINELPRLFANGVGSYFIDDGTEVPTQMGLYVHLLQENGVRATGGMRAIATIPEGVVTFNLQVRLVPK